MTAVIGTKLFSGQRKMNQFRKKRRKSGHPGRQYVIIAGGGGWWGGGGSLQLPVKRESPEAGTNQALHPHEGVPDQTKAPAFSVGTAAAQTWGGGEAGGGGGRRVFHKPPRLCYWAKRGFFRANLIGRGRC